MGFKNLFVLVLWTKVASALEGLRREIMFMYSRYKCDNIHYFMSRLAYQKLVGGVLAMPVKDFRLVNGFSNSYYGWGGEDDDMYQR